MAGPPGEAAGLSIVKGDELNQLFVAAAARGSGVGTILIDDAEQRIAAAGYRIAWLACAIGNDRAARFYEKRGWQRTVTFTSRLETPDGEFLLDVWRYEKSVGIQPGR